MTPDFIAVVSIERTGGTSVFRSLAGVFPSDRLRHVHYLDGRRHGTSHDPAEAALQEFKRGREIETGLRLRDAGRRRVVFTILRDPFDRLVSGLWYGRGALFAAFLDPTTGELGREAETLLGPAAASLLERHDRYGEEVFERLGLTVRPGPGRHDLEDGLTAYVLRFERLEDDFADAAQAVFGFPVPLLHLNTAGRFGDRESYQAFRRLCERALVEERRAFDAAPGPSRLGVPLGGGPKPTGDLEALRLLAAAGAHPDSSRAWRKAAEALRAAGEAQSELEVWRRIAALDGPDSKSLGRVVTLLKSLGRGDEAEVAHAQLKALLGAGEAGGVSGRDVPAPGG